MENNNDILSVCPLFKGIGADDRKDLLDCLHAAVQIYDKKEFILLTGEKVTEVGIVLSGTIHVIQEDFWGNRTIIGNAGPGGLFGEAFSCGEIERLPVSVIAAKKSEIMWIDYQKIITTCSSACLFHSQLMKNMVRILARKNVMLTQKIEHIGKRTIREKILSYLSAQALAERKRIFEIPYSRQELADYLGVNRSALSRELGLMQKEKILAFEQNCFELIE